MSATVYVAPGLAEFLSTTSQSYIIGVMSFFVFAVSGMLAVCALMKIDYSGDTLLTVDVSGSAAGARED